MLMITILLPLLRMHTPFLTLGSKGASGYLTGAVAVKNPGRGAKFVMSKREPEQEANRVCQAIASQIGKIHGRPGNRDTALNWVQVTDRSASESYLVCR